MHLLDWTSTNETPWNPTKLPRVASLAGSSTTAPKRQGVYTLVATCVKVITSNRHKQAANMTRAQAAAGWDPTCGVRQQGHWVHPLEEGLPCTYTTG
jgi:hypothetical protein